MEDTGFEDFLEENGEWDEWDDYLYIPDPMDISKFEKIENYEEDISN